MIFLSNLQFVCRGQMRGQMCASGGMRADAVEICEEKSSTLEMKAEKYSEKVRKPGQFMGDIRKKAAGKCKKSIVLGCEGAAIVL